MPAEARFPERSEQILEGLGVTAADLWLVDRLVWVEGPAKTRFDYRPVHLTTLTDEVETIPPKARTY